MSADDSDWADEERHHDEQRALAETADVDGARLLDDLVAFLRRFVAFVSLAQAYAVALWIIHTHTIRAATMSPRLAVQSAEKESGKTRLLEVLAVLCADPVMAANVSAAAMFRVIESERPTLLIDEVDAVFSPKAANGTEELRQLLNAGYTASGQVLRAAVHGKKVTTERFNVFAPVALAGIGTLPDTVQSRAVVVRLKKRAPGERVDRFRPRLIAPEAERLRGRAERWAIRHLPRLGDTYPAEIDDLSDRASDIWEPLLAIAEVAGADWPARARAAALALSTTITEDDSIGVRLLADLRDVFGNDDRAFTHDLLARLNALDESPWGDWYGRPIDARRLAKLLKPYGIRPQRSTFRIGDEVGRGYLKESFVDAWARYLPSPGTSLQPSQGLQPAPALAPVVTDVTAVTEFRRGGEGDLGARCTDAIDEDDQ